MACRRVDEKELQGLKVLARIIAAAHIRRLAEAEAIELHPPRSTEQGHLAEGDSQVDCPLYIQWPGGPADGEA